MEVTRLFDVLDHQAQTYPQEIAMSSKVEGQWKNYNTNEVIDIVNRLSLGVLSLGIKKGDKIAIVSNSRPEWSFTDLAMQQLGVITVPLYTNSTEEDYKFICSDAEVKMAFAESDETYQKIKKATSGLDLVQEIITYDKLDGVKNWQDILAPRDTDLGELEKIKATISDEELATIIYTSGTTGMPKGVMLCHRNIISNAKAVADAFEVVGPGYKVLCFLPMCHIFARTELYAYMNMGVTIYYAESMESIGENLKEIKPDFFATVPRLLEKVYDKIVTKGYELTGIKKQLFFWALNLANRFDPEKSHGAWYNFQLKLANKIIFTKWRDALGGNIKFIVSGAAALQPKLAKIYWAAGIHVLEAYGQTETSPGVTLTRNYVERLKIGCVGELLQDIEVRIAEDGEILVKGPCVMMGYYNRPEITKETIDSDGWLHTGDIGEMVDGTHLKITDRKKEIFKTSGGKYIAPQEIENKLKESMLIEHAMIVGESQKFPAALILPFEDALKDWCKIHEIEFTNLEQVVANPKVIEKFDREIEKSNNTLAQYKKVKKFKLLSEPWTIDGGELTPTLKPKRKIIKGKNLEAIEGFYR